MAGAEGTFYLIILFSLEFLRRRASPPQARSPRHAAQPSHKTPGLARPHAGGFGPGTHSFPWSIGAEQILPFPRRGGRQHKVAPAPVGAARGDSQLLPSQPHTQFLGVGSAAPLHPGSWMQLQVPALCSYRFGFLVLETWAGAARDAGGGDGARGEGSGEFGLSWDRIELGADPSSLWKVNLCALGVFSPSSKCCFPTRPGFLFPLPWLRVPPETPVLPGRMEREQAGPQPGPCPSHSAGSAFPEPGSGNLVCLFAVQC